MIPMLLGFQSIDLNKNSNNSDTTKITVIGKAIVNKNQAAVLTDDSLLYYLDGIHNWDVKYKGEKVKVTGELKIPPPPVRKNPDPNITIIPQPRFRDGETIKNAKWKLVE